MKANEARNIAIDYLYNAADSFYTISAKITIDDKGTLSEEGYNDSDCEDIQKQLAFLIKKLLKLKTTPNEQHTK